MNIESLETLGPIKVISYCKLPEEISEKNSSINEASCDSYIKYKITSKNDQDKYDDNFDLDNYIIEQFPELEGKEILIHIDY